MFGMWRSNYSLRPHQINLRPASLEPTVAREGMVAGSSVRDAKEDGQSWDGYVTKALNVLHSFETCKSRYPARKLQGDVTV